MRKNTNKKQREKDFAKTAEMLFGPLFFYIRREYFHRKNQKKGKQVCFLFQEKRTDKIETSTETGNRQMERRIKREEKTWKTKIVPLLK